MTRFKGKDYEMLEGWMRFVNSEDESAPGVPMLITRNPEARESLRQAAAKVLRAIASRPATGSLKIVVLPRRPPPRLHIVGNTLRLLEAEDFRLVRAEDCLGKLLDALGIKETPKRAPDTEQRDLSRIKTCCEDKCGKLFLAMDCRAKHCSPRCASRQRQRNFYTKHAADERARKRADYKKNRLRNIAARRRRKRKLFLDGTPLKPIIRPGRPTPYEKGRAL